MTAPPLPSFHHRDFAGRGLVEIKGDHVVSVCIPARDEAATVGKVVSELRRQLVDRVGLVDEVVVVDDHSTDRTAKVAEKAGARVVAAAEILPELVGGHGKGEAMWRSLHAARGDLIVWCDADITDFGPRFVVGLLGPLLTEPDIAFVKGFYDRPLITGVGGGRVTELVARPLLATLFPELAAIRQPLSGEYAGRRDVLERLPFVRGYGVDFGLLVDVAAGVGVHAIAQVDLGTRRHRNRHLHELSPQALAVLQTALHRAGVPAPNPALLERPDHEPVIQAFGEIPPLAEVLDQLPSLSA
ncbi:MAG TPA: glucosyl-3-phosphoglycerate synthase [Acidimicrobiales bacterium]|jgi:glucosyl-3-phosphoglycerate synthase